MDQQCQLVEHDGVEAFHQFSLGYFNTLKASGIPFILEVIKDNEDIRWTTSIVADKYIIEVSDKYTSFDADGLHDDYDGGVAIAGSTPLKRLCVAHNVLTHDGNIQDVLDALTRYEQEINNATT